MNTLETLYTSVQTRPRPEDVAELVLETLNTRLTPQEQKVLDKAAQHSFKRISARWQNAYTWSSMADDFTRPVSAQKQVETASKVFGTPALTAEDALIPEKVEKFIEDVSASIHRDKASTDKMNKAERHAVGLYKTQGWYNKRWRMCVNLEDKLRRLTKETRKYFFTRVGKSALAVEIPKKDFLKDENTACFLAYMSARMSKRSIFTNGKQERAFDEVAEMLLKRCEQNAHSTQWDLLAYVMPDKRVLSHLSDEKKGQLLGKWWTVLIDMADMLHDVHKKTNFNLETMVVTRGTDSSTWNQVAGGWNQARTHWISLLHALNSEALLDSLCPGKVMRLMAADVMYWHDATTEGDAIHPDTKVWAHLPMPWDVMRGVQKCTRLMVTEVCNLYGVEPQTWTGARENRQAVEFKPTPELVHGVSVSSPMLAKALRDAGIFSGKNVSKSQHGINYEVQRDELGFALSASETSKGKINTR